MKIKFAENFLRRIVSNVTTNSCLAVCLMGGFHVELSLVVVSPMCFVHVLTHASRNVPLIP